MFFSGEDLKRFLICSIQNKSAQILKITIMKIQIKNNFGGESEVFDFSQLTLNDLEVLIKYSGSLTIEKI